MKNQVDSIVYHTEKQLKEFCDNIPARVKETIKAKNRELRDAILEGSIKP